MAPNTSETIELQVIHGDWASPGEIDCDAVQNLLTEIENELNNLNSTSPNVTKKSLEHWPKTVCKKWNNDQSPEPAPLEAIKGCLNADQSKEIMPPHGKMYDYLMMIYLTQWRQEVSEDTLVQHLPNPNEIMAPYLAHHLLWALQMGHYPALWHVTHTLKQLKRQNNNNNYHDGDLEEIEPMLSFEDKNETRSKRQSDPEIYLQRKMQSSNQREHEMGKQHRKRIVLCAYNAMKLLIDDFGSSKEHYSFVTDGNPEVRSKTVPHGPSYKEKLMTTYLDQWNDEVSIEKLIRHLPNPKQTMKPYLIQHRLWALQIWHHEALLQLTCILKRLKLQNDYTGLMICLDGKNLEALNAWTSMDENITRSRKRQSYQEICRQEEICHPNKLDIGMKCLQELIPSTYRDVQEVLENFASLYEESTWVKAISFMFKVALPSYIMLWISFWTFGNDIKTNQQYSQAHEWFCGNESSIVEKNECRKWQSFFRLSNVNFVMLSVFYLANFVQSSVSFVKVLWDVFRTNKSACTSKIREIVIVSFFLFNLVIAFFIALGYTLINGSYWYFIVTLHVKLMVCADFISFHFRFWMNPSYAAGILAIEFQKQYILWTLYEVCVFNVVQLCLRLWYVSSETEMNGSFIFVFVHVVSSILSFEESEVQFGSKQLHVIRIFLACASLVFSLGGLQRRMKNNCVGIINMSFFYLSLLCQILARVIVILTLVRSFPENVGCQIGSVGAFLLINCLCGFGVQILNLHFNHELPTKFFDWCLLFLSGPCSSLVLVHVPLAKLDSPPKETPKTPTFDMYFFYLFTAIVSNFGSVLLNQSTSNWSVWEPFVLVVVATVCQIIYYKGFGHPWKKLNGQEPKETWKGLKRFLSSLKNNFINLIVNIKTSLFGKDQSNERNVSNANPA